MLPLRVFVVSLLLPAGTLCISSHSPLDLFAYPAYTVKLNPASPISNTSAEAILAAATASKADVQEVSHEGGERTTRQNELDLQDGRNADLLGLHDSDPHGQQQPHDQQLIGPVKPYLLRSSSNGQAYLCSVPQPSQAASPSSSSSSSKKASGELVKDSSTAADSKGQPQAALTEAEREERRVKNELEKKEAFECGLALLEPLKGTCLYLTQGWFTCESGALHASFLRLQPDVSLYRCFLLWFRDQTISCSQES